MTRGRPLAAPAKPPDTSADSCLEPAPVEVLGGDEILAEVGSDPVSRIFVAFDLLARERDRYVRFLRIEPEWDRDDFSLMAQRD